MATPVINQPQVAILDVEAVVKRPVVVTDADGNDSIAIRPMCVPRPVLGPPRARRRGGRAVPGRRSATGCRRSRRRGAPAIMGSMPELWTVHLGVVPYREALDLQHRVRAARQADAVPDVLLLLEHPPDVHARPAQRPRRARARRGLVPRPGHRGRRRRPRRQGDLPRARAARRLPDRAHRRRHRATCGRWRTRSSRRSSDEGVAARSRPEDGPDYTGVWAGRPQDRLDRRARRPRRHHARLRGQRRQRPRPVHLGRRLRAARRAR